MYTGSMVGIGAIPFAVWGYVISHQRPPHFEVELNPKILAVMIGEAPEDIERAIEMFCQPDPESRTDTLEGRKLERIGTFLFRVVNGLVYDRIRNNEERKEYWREQKRKAREAKQGQPPSISAPVNPPAVPEKPAKPPVTRPERPDLEAVKLVAAKIGLSEIEAEKFFNYYEANGWKTGPNPIKSWTHALNGWKLRNETNARPNRNVPQSVDRNVGNANEGKAHLYKGLGSVSVPDRP